MILTAWERQFAEAWLYSWKEGITVAEEESRPSLDDSEHNFMCKI